MTDGLLARLQRAAQRSDLAQMRLQALNPKQRLLGGRQSLQALAVRLQHALQAALGTKAQRLRLGAHRLQRVGPQAAIRLHRNTAAALHHRLHRALQAGLTTRLLRLKSAGGNLNALSPLATLGRGYSILRDDQRRIIHSIPQTAPGQSLRATLSDGELAVSVVSDAR